MREVESHGKSTVGVGESRTLGAKNLGVGEFGRVALAQRGYWNATVDAVAEGPGAGLADERGVDRGLFLDPYSHRV